MSHEQEELRRLAQKERHAAWTSVKRLPGCAGDTASAFARKHPVWAAGGAAALAMGLVSRRRRATGVQGPTSSWPAALAAAGVRYLPELLRLVGLTAATEPKTHDDANPVVPPDPVNMRA